MRVLRREVPRRARTSHRLRHFRNARAGLVAVASLFYISHRHRPRRFNEGGTSRKRARISGYHQASKCGRCIPGAREEHTGTLRRTKRSNGAARRSRTRFFADAARQHNWRLSYRTSAHPPTLYRSTLLFLLLLASILTVSLSSRSPSSATASSTFLMLLVVAVLLIVPSPMCYLYIGYSPLPTSASATLSVALTLVPRNGHSPSLPEGRRWT